MGNDISNRVYDRAVFLANFEGMEEIVGEVIGSFEEGLPALLDQVESAIKEGDAAKLQLSAHTLKGVVSNFYAEPSRLLAFQLEKMGREKLLAGADSVFQKMAEEIALLSAELKVLAREKGLL